jgi:hypothetical protein
MGQGADLDWSDVSDAEIDRFVEEFFRECFDLGTYDRVDTRVTPPSDQD